MKKQIFILMLSSLLFSCMASNQEITENKTPTKSDLVGSWSCKTKYKDIKVGTVDLINLNDDGTVEDDNFIFDNSLTSMEDGEVDDYFESFMRYLKISSGTWLFKNNQLILSLKPSSINRIIDHVVFKEMQEYDVIREYENDIFKTLSSNEEGEIKLNFIGFTQDGFVTEQTMGSKKYKGYCTKKEKTAFKFNQRLEYYKKFLAKD